MRIQLEDAPQSLRLPPFLHRADRAWGFTQVAPVVHVAWCRRQ